ncbi:MAG: PilN domain-containing protein [Cardiobacteriaceae bacterium]|nr:PilN domain-containing protein [Cardiobacteriaceae bacterium]
MSRKFNLQPWRAAKREAQRKEFVTITLALFLLTALLCGFSYWMEKQYAEKQQQGITLLRNDIEQYKKAKAEVDKIKKLNDELTIQINTIQKLQDQRGLAVAMLDHLALHTPENVFITNLNFQGNTVTVQGVAENEPGVSAFMREMHKFSPFAIPELVRIDEAKSTPIFNVAAGSEVKTFTVLVKVKTDSEN